MHFDVGNMLCVYVCIGDRMYGCLHVCVVYVCVCRSVCVYAYMHVCMVVFVCVVMRVSLYACVCEWVSICVD